MLPQVQKISAQQPHLILVGLMWGLAYKMYLSLLEGVANKVACAAGNGKREDARVFLEALVILWHPKNTSERHYFGGRPECRGDTKASQIGYANIVIVELDQLHTYCAVTAS